MNTTPNDTDINIEVDTNAEVDIDFCFDFDLPSEPVNVLVGPRISERVRLQRLYAEPHVKARMKLWAERAALKRIKAAEDFRVFLQELGEEAAL